MAKYIVCSALPYANGPLHIGHLAGCYLPADVYVRFKRLQGHDVHYVCGSDEHGAAITFLALKMNASPKSIVDKYHEVLKNDLEACGIDFDIFSRTTHPCHINRSQEFFLNLKNKGLIETKTEKRLYCSSCEKFLPDRYVVGECPKCHSLSARGDQCEKCGTWYEPEQLINPICQICGKTKAVLKDTTHWYLSLNKLEQKLTNWLESKTWWRKSVLGYAFQPLKSELVPRSITRDLDWGVPVPLAEAKDKVLYVWFDAPIGYISASEDWSIRQNKPNLWESYWADPETKLIHFIGKDNIVFHTVVWPAILMGDGRYVLPHLVAGNEFLNLEGEKISTSRNFAIWTSEAVKLVDRDLLRYYLTRIAPETSDSNFTWADFQSKVNTELADIIGNLVNRCLTFLAKNYAGQICVDAKPVSDPRVSDKIADALKRYTEGMELGLSKLASEEVVGLGRFLNSFMQESSPWSLRKTDPEKAHRVLQDLLFGIKALAVLLFPICPKLANNIFKQLGFEKSIDQLGIEEVTRPYEMNQKLSNEIQPVVQKMEDSLVAEQRQKLDLVLTGGR